MSGQREQDVAGHDDPRDRQGRAATPRERKGGNGQQHDRQDHRPAGRSRRGAEERGEDVAEHGEREERVPEPLVQVADPVPSSERAHTSNVRPGATGRRRPGGGRDGGPLAFAPRAGALGRWEWREADSAVPL